MAFEPPPELIALILKFLTPDELVNYVTVSRSWQMRLKDVHFGESN